MWRSRSKSSARIQRTFSKNLSFKDIESLCSDENKNNNSDPIPSPNPNPIPSSFKSNHNKPSVFHRVLRANTVLRALGAPPPSSVPAPPPEHEPTPSLPPHNAEAEQPEPSISIPGAEKRIVVYLTSLRVVRSIFEDCRTVQSILRGFRVTVDERDLSMDSALMEELQRILKIHEKRKLALPRVFIGGRYIGGAEEVRQLNETGELKKIVEGMPAAEGGVCEGCGGYRFILCDVCSGSHKCYTEKSSGFRSCTACNENGLIRCPSCSI